MSAIDARIVVVRSTMTDRLMDGGDVGLTPKQAEKITGVLMAPWKDEPKEVSK